MIKSTARSYGDGKHPGMREKSYPSNSSMIKTTVSKVRSGNDSFGDGRVGRGRGIKTNVVSER